MKRTLLRLILAATALGWLAAGVAVFLPWDTAATLLHNLGADAMTHDPMLDYWLRMMGGAFAGIGVFFLMLARAPEKHEPLLSPAAWFLLAEGAVLLAHGIRLELAPLPFWADTASCFGAGAAILLLRPAPRVA